jgi:hypothetical protein
MQNQGKLARNGKKQRRKFVSRETWLAYESEKRRIANMVSDSDEYEEATKRLCARLGI